MCGLAGWCNFADGAPADHELLGRMAAKLVHRGPDSSGCFADDRVGFAFRRLKIIDLAGGEQPMCNEDGSLVLVCNGEIFNYQELERELTARGHVFRTASDVEVLLHLYEERGPDLLHAVNGQFAFALYDRRAGRLLLARDHFGVNPLHYTVTGGTLVFGSEIKAMLEHPAVPREVDLTGLDQVLCFPGLVSPRTMFKGIHSLPPGHFLTASAGGVRVEEYWDLDYPLRGETYPERREEEVIAELRDRFAQSVRYRLHADVPVGLYLSGGLDSSLIAAMSHREAPGFAGHSFSIGFTDRSISETAFQRLMAEQVGSRHQEIVFDWAEIESRMPRMIWQCECPIKETYNTCSLALSQAAREAGVAVILTGEGADELFAGYVGYRFDQAGDRGARGSRLDEACEEELRERLWGDPGFFYEKDYFAFRETRQALYSEAVGRELAELDCTNESPIDRDKVRGRHPVHQRSYVDFKLRMADHLLADHGDRMALAHSIEARYPFLDVGLVEFARRLPPELKIRDLEEKYALKRMAAGLVPDSIIRREKFGFHAPGSPYLLRHNIEWINDLLASDRIARQGYFNPRAVETLRRQYAAPDFTLNLPFDSDLLVVVLSFGIFLDTFELPSR